MIRSWLPHKRRVELSGHAIRMFDFPEQERLAVQGLLVYGFLDDWKAFTVGSNLWMELLGVFENFELAFDTRKRIYQNVLILQMHVVAQTPFHEIKRGFPRHKTAHGENRKRSFSSDDLPSRSTKSSPFLVVVSE